jgi:L-alanine-DL-glutamate epimerase-like enolase superfamily enzyme
MKVIATPYELKLIKPFGIARSTRTTNSIVLIKLDDSGYGEASPSAYYGENVSTVLKTVTEAASQIPGHALDVNETMNLLTRRFPAHAAARAAVDMALHDIIAKRQGLPLYAFLGLQPPQRAQTSYTIGIAPIDEMLEKVDAARDHPILKIKLGKDPDHDLAVMREIRKRTNQTIRVDANGGWNLDNALKCINALADLDVEYVEQPLERGSLDELVQLKKASPLPIFLDEDVMVSSDISKVVGKCDGINIKLMKCGGIAEAVNMIRMARSFDLQIMLGCMIESSLAVTAASHLASQVDYLDLDGNLLVSNDPFQGMTLENKFLRVPQTPGLGATPREDIAELFQTGSV